MKQLIYICIALVAFAAPAQANDARVLELVKSLEAQTKAWEETMDANQQRQLAAIRGHVATVEAIRQADTDIRTAVKSCEKHNPDMKEPLQTSLRNWTTAIEAHIKNSHPRLKQMVAGQTFAKQADVHKYIRDYKELVALQDKKIKRIPIHGKDECEDLAEDIDDDSEEINELLQKALVLDKDLNYTE
ncbi:MAG: hypothetical protein GC136_00660 [Alphaproteobacteria bacterium]|nr:hypothetical protein [Alphaproteobacteria bacterium]